MRPDACKALLEALNIESHFMNTIKYDVFVLLFSLVYFYYFLLCQYNFYIRRMYEGYN